jgi:hypothetical protein
MLAGGKDKVKMDQGKDNIKMNYFGLHWPLGPSCHAFFPEVQNHDLKIPAIVGCFFSAEAKHLIQRCLTRFSVPKLYGGNHTPSNRQFSSRAQHHNLKIPAIVGCFFSAEAKHPIQRRLTRFTVPKLYGGNIQAIIRLHTVS